MEYGLVALYTLNPHKNHTASSRSEQPQLSLTMPGLKAHHRHPSGGYRSHRVTSHTPWSIVPTAVGLVFLLFLGTGFLFLYRYSTVSSSTKSSCPPGSWPALEAQPGSYMGQEVDLLGKGVMAYVVSPPDGTSVLGGIISFQDIYRYNSGRNKGVADQFALAGFVVVHVDFIGTDVYTNDQNLMTYVKERSYSDFIKPKIIDSVIPYLKDEKGVEKIALIGYCWGCYLAFQMCADPDLKHLISATALFHPSLQLNKAFDRDPESKDIAEQITCPTLFVPAGTDPAFVGPDGSLMKILQNTSPDSQSVVMQDMKHGFVIRGDVNDSAVSRDVQRSLELATSFLQKHI